MDSDSFPLPCGWARGGELASFCCPVGIYSVDACPALDERRSQLESGVDLSRAEEKRDERPECVERPWIVGRKRARSDLEDVANQSDRFVDLLQVGECRG